MATQTRNLSLCVQLFYNTQWIWTTTTTSRYYPKKQIEQKQPCDAPAHRNPDERGITTERGRRYEQRHCAETGDGDIPGFRQLENTAVADRIAPIRKLPPRVRLWTLSVRKSLLFGFNQDTLRAPQTGPEGDAMAESIDGDAAPPCAADREQRECETPSVDRASALCTG